MDDQDLSVLMFSVSGVNSLARSDNFRGSTPGLRDLSGALLLRPSSPPWAFFVLKAQLEREDRDERR